MHPLFFSIKRAHYSVLRFAGGLLRRFGLTPARFDLLFLLRAKAVTSQCALHRELGVCRMVVSRMLRALEELGLVTRRPIRYGGRSLHVWLSERGKAKVEAVLDSLLDAGIVRLAIDSVLAPDDWYAWGETSRVKAKLGQRLRRIRDELGHCAATFTPYLAMDEQHHCKRPFERMDEWLELIPDLLAWPRRADLFLDDPYDAADEATFLEHLIYDWDEVG